MTTKPSTRFYGLAIAVGTGRLTLDSAARQLPNGPIARRQRDRRHATYTLASTAETRLPNK